MPESLGFFLTSPLQIEDIDRIELVSQMLPHTVKRTSFNKAGVCDERDYSPFSLEAIRCPIELL